MSSDNQSDPQESEVRIYTLTVVARNKHGQPKTYGLDDFTVDIRKKKIPMLGVSSSCLSRDLIRHSSRNMKMQGITADSPGDRDDEHNSFEVLQTADNGNGTYTAKYKLSGSGKYTINVKLNGRTVRGFPIIHEF